MSYYEGQGKYGFTEYRSRPDDDPVEVVVSVVREIQSIQYRGAYAIADAVTNTIGYIGMASGAATMTLGAGIGVAGVATLNPELVGLGALHATLGYVDYRAGRALVDLL